jgi:hypothetical protein
VLWKVDVCYCYKCCPISFEEEVLLRYPWFTACPSGENLTFSIARKNFVQILNIENKHWVVITNVNSNHSTHINVYDSLNWKYLSEKNKEQIACMIHTAEKKFSFSFPKVNIKKVSVIVVSLQLHLPLQFAWVKIPPPPNMF